MCRRNSQKELAAFHVFAKELSLLAKRLLKLETGFRLVVFIACRRHNTVTNNITIIVIIKIMIIELRRTGLKWSQYRLNEKERFSRLSPIDSLSTLTFPCQFVNYWKFASDNQEINVCRLEKRQYRLRCTFCRRDY